MNHPKDTFHGFATGAAHPIHGHAGALPARRRPGRRWAPLPTVVTEEGTQNAANHLRAQ